MDDARTRRSTAGDPDFRPPHPQQPEFIQTPAVQAHLACARLRSGCVHYRSGRRISFALGSPIAEPGQLRSAAAEFDDWLRGRNMRSAYFGVEAEYAECLAEGRRQILIGSQPILTTADWQDIKQHSAGLRTQIRRGLRRVRIVPMTPEATDYATEIQDCLKSWLGTRPAPPMGFAADARLSTELKHFHSVHAAIDESGVIQAYLCLSALPAGRRFLAEHMIRRRHAPNGVMEALIDHLFSNQILSAEAQLSLGLVALSERYLGRPYTNPLSFRFLRRLARGLGSRAYRFHGLEQFRRRLCPLTWSPVFLLADSSLSMAAIAVGLACLFFQSGPPGIG